MVGSRAKPFHCLWCNDVAEKWSPSGFFAVFTEIDALPKRLSWLAEARGGRSARQALMPRAWAIHGRDLDEIIARCIDNDVGARWEFREAGKNLYVFKTWERFRAHVDPIMT
jgi:hypothetical protein